MRDLEIAKSRLAQEDLTLVIVRNGHVVFESGSHGISGVLEAVRESGKELVGASAADRVVGKAVALLCVYAHVREVFACILSRAARDVLQRNGILVHWDSLVDRVSDSETDGMCRYEKLVAEINDPTGGYRKLSAFESDRSGLETGNHEREQFISEKNHELERIRARRLAELQGRRRKMTDDPIHVTDGNFEELTKKSPLALIDFWASWCGPCLALAPTIEELAKDYKERILVGKLNVDENPKTAECFHVFSIPTMVIMKNGCEVDRIVGCVQKQYIEAALKKHMG